ncbi:MAG: 50S ribosomal protein L18e [Candidatus Bathyarchaeia archaeon]|nr:50S ribosomal protein L18e [Candidatus Bathyarchaeota archaeon]
MLVKKTNPQLIELVKILQKASRKNCAPIWSAILQSLLKPRKHMARVNVGRIARVTRGGDTVAVPGKVLGSGKINHQITVAALGFSSTAVKRITSTGGRCITIGKLLEENPRGNHVKIIR